MGVYDFDKVGVDKCQCYGDFKCVKKFWQGFGQCDFQENCEL